jgi:hypothetical protein
MTQISEQTQVLDAVPLSMAYLLGDRDYEVLLRRDLNPKSKKSRKIDCLQTRTNVPGYSLLRYTHYQVPQDKLFGSVRAQLTHTRFALGQLLADPTLEDRPAIRIDSVDCQSRYLVTTRKSGFQLDGRILVRSSEDNLTALIHQCGRLKSFWHFSTVFYINSETAAKFDLI